MENTPHSQPVAQPIPPPPPFALDPSCEFDVDLADEGDALEAAALARTTDPEGVEFLGEYASLVDYMRSQLEPDISGGCRWLLDHLDWSAVQEQFEADGSRLMIEHGHVYRLMLGLLMVLSITATGCGFDAHGIESSSSGGESSTAPC